MARGKTGAGSRRSPAGRSGWATWPLERLLDVKMCDLGLGLEGSWLEEPIERIERDLAARGLRFRRVELKTTRVPSRVHRG